MHIGYSLHTYPAQSRRLLSVFQQVDLSKNFYFRQVDDFYERQGFTPEGEVFMDAGIEHIAMRRPFFPG